MFDKTTQRVVRIIGHKNPDTDSVCSAISYAYLKNQISDLPYEPRRAGEISRETEFVLNHFGVEAPRLSVDMSPNISYIDIREEPGVDGEMSMQAAWHRMMERHIDTLCVTDAGNHLLGLITVKDIANANMDLFDTGVLASSHTSYKNLIETLDGKMLVGDPDGVITTGCILVGTSPEVMEEMVHKGDLVMVTNRYEAQMCAIDCGASCLVVCADSTVPPLLLKRAEAAGCTVIQTHYDTYPSARLVSMAAPIRHFMKSRDLVTFNLNTPIEEAKKVMASLRHRYFPILDADGLYTGVVSRRNLLNMHRKKVILVDHNERSQAVDGLEEAEILEIIDHHRIGTLETSGPVYFRNEPVGCTATIIYSMFHEHSVEIPQQIAGLLLSAILSDTLMFHSPTCTMVDKAAAEDLAKIAGENIEEYGPKMFEAGEDLTGRTAEDVLYTDYKEFALDDYTISVGQGFFMSKKAYNHAKKLVKAYLPEAVEHSGSAMIFYMLTSIPDQSTRLLCAGNGAQEAVEQAFHVQGKDGEFDLPGIVSRKKQLIPPLREVLRG
ncbi:MAG: putative manganese-dependent inorganic diphosphatase [Lachnospiraceae bacterium]|nr:putative manganese-dependent inorganic diphosphatase [Lachnospiraceae bacterium]